ncbi:MAG: CCA tRNA nucleotidyltransferase [Pirellulales bacterium]
MNSAHDPHETRRFALEIVQRLRSAGYEALWAGGCVRDQLLGQTPKDYDVATSATPREIREVFGFRHTLPLGAAFGVITVLGKRRACPVEVATFRQDAQYSDGRHPDAVTFSSAAEDAKRRDFTINGMFYDPLAEQVVDYVGGQEDLQAGVVRAIGDPRARFNEDKLRMLRAVRFAATFHFALEPATLAAIQQLAAEIVIVSAERIAAEMRRIFPHRNRRRGVELLSVTRLLPILLPELQSLDPEADGAADETARRTWSTTLERIQLLEDPTFSTVLAALVRDVVRNREDAAATVHNLCDRWRLSNDERDRVAWLLESEPVASSARSLPWPVVQRLLVEDGIGELLTYLEGVLQAEHRSLDDVAFCRAKLALPAAELNPPPLLTGNDLRQAGWQPGPQFRVWLQAVRDAQLERRIGTRDEALALVRTLAAGPI